MNRKITVTFDNGPTPGVTEQVLDVLADAGVRSTFFVIGNRLRDPAAMDCARRAYAEGHWIGNHTTTHQVLFGASGSDRVAKDEIEIAQTLIGNLSHPDRLFRPFAGGGVLDRRVFSRATVAHLKEARYTCVTWNSIPHDWEDADGWVETAMNHIAKHDWTVTVLHDIDSGAMTRLRTFLDRLCAAGVEVTQRFPDRCVPIFRGHQRASLDHLMPTPADQP